MQKVSIHNLKQGMTTYNRLCAADGRVLLGSQVELNERYIKQMQKLGIYCLTINNPIIERLGITCEETLPEEKKTDISKSLKEAFDDASKGHLVDVRCISDMAKIIEDTTRINQIIKLDNITTAEDCVYTHGVNVAVLGVIIASDLGYNAMQMHDFVMGALLHDIGKVLADDKSNDREHPQKGFEYVRKIRGYSAISGHVILEHHEKYDGTGFPRGMKGEKIHEYARIAAVADVYDNLVSGYQSGKAFLPHQAYEAIMAMSGTYLDNDIANVFLAKAPLYPVGTFVTLDSGHIGVVVEALPKLQSRPTVMLLTDETGALSNEWSELRLTDNLTTFITGILSEEEVLTFTKNYEDRQ